MNERDLKRIEVLTEVVSGRRTVVSTAETLRILAAEVRLTKPSGAYAGRNDDGSEPEVEFASEFFGERLVLNEFAEPRCYRRRNYHCHIRKSISLVTA